MRRTLCPTLSPVLVPALAAILVACPCADGQPGPDGFTVREGYKVTVAVPSLDNARFMEFDDKGTLYVSRPSEGDIVALRDENGDGEFEKRSTFVSDRATVHGLCFAGGWLWFSTSGSVHQARDTDGDGVADQVIDIITAGQIPSRGGHWWRSLLVTDSNIFTSIGDSGNATDEMASERQKVWRFSLDGAGKTLFCSGLRNTEKLRVRPGTREIWGFDHGSDWFGRKAGDREGSQPVTDLNPPDELNLYAEGAFYGHPFIVGNRLPRYEFLDRDDLHDLAVRTVPPKWSVGAHWAVNGWTFIDPVVNRRTRALPADTEGDIFFAAHGSWNSAAPVGYCVGRVLFDKDPGPDNGRPYGLQKVVSTLGSGGQVLARPVDCVQAPDGTILFSTDQPGRIYRISSVEAPE